jgi:hypothetical protein
LIRFDEGNGTVVLVLVVFEAAPHVSTAQVRMTAAIPMSCIVVDFDGRLDDFLRFAVALAGYVACLKGLLYIATESMGYCWCFLHHSNGVNQ